LIAREDRLERTLVTGATGLVGYNILQALLGRRRSVRALVRTLDKGKMLLPEACDLVQSDVTDAAAVRRETEGCAVVYHPAGLPEQWLPDPAGFDQVNAGGTRNAVQAALGLGVRRFVYIRPYDILAGEASRELDESRLDPQPRPTPYERSKQAADREVVTALENGLPALFLHPAAVYGPGPCGSPGLDKAMAQLRDGSLSSLAPGGMGVVFVSHVGEGHVLAEELAPVGSRYILCEGCPTLTELARAVLAEAAGSAAARHGTASGGACRCLALRRRGALHRPADADRPRLADVPAGAGPSMQRQGAARAGMAANPPAPGDRADAGLSEGEMTAARRQDYVRSVRSLPPL
jgi:dihydroflavonol-4-reductase